MRAISLGLKDSTRSFCYSCWSSWSFLSFKFPQVPSNYTLSGFFTSFFSLLTIVGLLCKRWVNFDPLPDSIGDSSSRPCLVLAEIGDSPSPFSFIGDRASSLSANDIYCISFFSTSSELNDHSLEASDWKLLLRLVFGIDILCTTFGGVFCLIYCARRWTPIDRISFLTVSLISRIFFFPYSISLALLLAISFCSSSRLSTMRF